MASKSKRGGSSGALGAGSPLCDLSRSIGSRPTDPLFGAFGGGDVSTHELSCLTIIEGAAEDGCLAGSAVLRFGGGPAGRLGAGLLICGAISGGPGIAPTRGGGAALYGASARLMVSATSAVSGAITAC